MAGQDPEIEELRAAVDCRYVLESAGWIFDKKESTPGAAKYRSVSQVIIVTRDGKGWFDTTSAARGDIFSLVQFLWDDNFGEARRRLRPMAGLSPTPGQVLPATPAAPRDVLSDWKAAKLPNGRSDGWGYLARDRALPAPTIERALHAGVLREGYYGTIWAAHRSGERAVCGWEMRGPNYKGFGKGGAKALFWVGAISQARRVCVTESFIDALSLASLEGWAEGSVYASTGGGFGPFTSKAIEDLVPASARLVAATDQGRAGDLLAERLRDLAEGKGIAFSRMRPEAKDWNLQLQEFASATK